MSSYKLLRPEIDMKILPMYNLTQETQERICSCPERCTRYVVLDDYGRYCENVARDVSLSIFSLVEGIGRVEPKKATRREWTLREIQFIQEWKKKYSGFRYGDTRLIAGMLGRPVGGVREKIKQLRRDGML